MTSDMIIRTVFEIFLAGFTIWALFHEDRFIAFERRIIYALRRRRNIKVVKRTCRQEQKCI